jgi:predicted kinase
MFTPLICHFLIGCPGSGKSTLAALLAKEGNYRIVSTDQIREALYGNASIQGDWSAIEAQVLSQIRSAIASNQPVIYDATNAKRDWRMELLMQLNSLTPPTAPEQGGALVTSHCYSLLKKGNRGGETVHWMAWHLTTPLETCKAWNQKRDRQVPDGVIESMFKSLQDFPPVLAEGFAAVNMVNYTTEGFDIPEIRGKIKRLSHTLTNYSNLTKPHKITPALL